MTIIKTHDITLYGGNDEYNIALEPLSDDHLPYLYKWNADPEVLYWTESDDVNDSYDTDTVHDIYGGVSQNAYCFLIQANSKPIGECWLQKMNLPNVIAMYPEMFDVRRIDMGIGEKEYWNKGIGSSFIRMLVDFAFCGEHVDVLHCFSEDYNKRSQRMWQKNGFSLMLTEDHLSKKGKQTYHFALTRQQYIENRRVIVPKDKVFMLPVSNLQPSQLYISDGKLRLTKEWFYPTDIAKFDPIPIKHWNGKNLMTDGHTRAVLAHLNGFTEIPCYIDEDELNMNSYATDVEWCNNEGVFGIADLSRRIVSYKDYEVLWRKRCMGM